MHICISPKSPHNFERRRRWMIWISYAVAFMVGSENAIIYPTAWKYLQELGISDENVLGLVIAAFNVGALISGVSFGILVDKLGRSRWIVLWLNLVSVIGNFMYCVGGSESMLVGGRFVTGIGGGIMSVIMAEIAKATRVSERTKVLAIAFGARQLGLAFGPVYYLIMGQASFSLGFIHISDTNFPGFFMLLVWTAFELLFFASYFDAGIEMQAIIDAEKNQRQRPGTYCSISDPSSVQLSTMREGSHGERSLLVTSSSAELDSRVPMRTAENDDIADAGKEEKTPAASMVNSDCRHNANGCESETKKDSKVDNLSRNESSIGLTRKYFNYFLTDTVVPLLFVQFLAFFLQNMLETAIPPATQFYFGYGPRTNSFIYLAMGVEAICAFVFFYFMVRRVSERVILAGSCALMVTGCSLGLVITSQLEEGNPDGFPLYMVGCSVVFLADPLASITTLTIFSKALPREVQGFAQGIRRVCNYLGLIMGPLYGGGLVYQGLALYSLPLLMSAIALILVIASFSRYKHFLER